MISMNFPCKRRSLFGRLIVLFTVSFCKSTSSPSSDANLRPSENLLLTEQEDENRFFEKKLASQPKPLSVEKILAFVARLGIKNAEPFGSGVLGQSQNSLFVFLADKSAVPDFERLNWDIVRALSEKHSCFIVDKTINENTFTYRCRSGKTVQLQRRESKRFIYFVSTRS